MPMLSKAYITEIKKIIKEARAKAYNAINYTMVEAYWLIGKRHDRHFRQGKGRFGDQRSPNYRKFASSAQLTHIQRIMH